jgi:hypothetical protein
MTETWWIVRLRGTDRRGNPYFAYLRCQNSYHVKYRRTSKGRRVPRKWGTNEWKSVAHPFKSVGEARRGSKCAIVQKKLKRGGYDMVEIVRCDGDRNK